MSAEIAATLRAARAQIADPARWTQGYEARRTDGTPTEAEDPAATCWCAIGAVAAVVPPGDLRDAAFGLLQQAVRRAVPTEDIGVGVFNDEYDHADVLALFDRAIAAADREAGHE